MYKSHSFQGSMTLCILDHVIKGLVWLCGGKCLDHDGQIHLHIGLVQQLKIMIETMKEYARKPLAEIIHCKSVLNHIIKGLHRI